MREGRSHTAIFCNFTTPDEAIPLEPAPDGTDRVARLGALLELEPFFAATGGAGIVGFRDDESFPILETLNGRRLVPFNERPKIE
jgi:hypothetical protein